MQKPPQNKSNFEFLTEKVYLIEKVTLENTFSISSLPSYL